MRSLALQTPASIRRLAANSIMKGDAHRMIRDDVPKHDRIT